MSVRSLFVVVLCATALGCGNDNDSKLHDAGPLPDASNIDARVGIGCNQQFCESGLACCIEQVVPPRVSYFCTNAAVPAQCQGAQFACDGPEDCGDGEVCCGADDSECTPIGQCQGSIVCHRLEHCPPGSIECRVTPLGIISTCR